MSERQLRRCFSGFVAALTAAGLADKKPPDRKPPRADVAKTIARPTPPRITIPGQRDILVIGDTHFPFTEVHALSALYEFVERKRPQVVVQVGDLFDCFAHGRFPRSRCIFNPQEEADLGFKMAADMWATIHKLSPGAECYQILGNHDSRPLKRILEAYPEGEVFFSIDRFYQFEGVKTLMDTRQELVIDGVAFIHGYLSGLGKHRDFMNRNVVCGHSHVGGVSFKNTLDPESGRMQTIWELNAGYLGDPTSKALSYTPQRITRWTLGWGYIDADGPRFIAL